MLNKDCPGNESFTITLTDLWYFSITSSRTQASSEFTVKEFD